MPRASFDADALLRSALRGERACGTFPIRIDRDGAWHHEGRRIERAGLVRLFAGVLRRADDGGYWLVTPGEQGRIEVEDAPFTIRRVEAAGVGAGQTLSFWTNLDEPVRLDSKHPLRLAEAPKGALVPYLLVRDRLEARITRPVYYELAGLAVEAPGDPATLGVWSAGSFFPLGPAEG